MQCALLSILQIDYLLHYIICPLREGSVFIFICVPRGSLMVMNMVFAVYEAWIQVPICHS